MILDGNARVRRRNPRVHKMRHADQRAWVPCVEYASFAETRGTTTKAYIVPNHGDMSVW